MPALAATTGTAERKAWMVSELTKDLFKQHVGEKFIVKASEPEVREELTLTAVEDAPERKTLGPDGKPLLETFTVTFESESEQSLVQRIYDFEHGGIGTFSLFMVPVVSNKPGVRRYEIVFNRLLREP